MPSDRDIFDTGPLPADGGTPAPGTHLRGVAGVATKPRTAIESSGADPPSTSSDDTPTAAYTTGPSSGLDGLGLSDGPSISQITLDPAASSGAQEGFQAPSPRRGQPSQIGPYRVVRQIGQGGMGAVYLVTPAESEKPVPMALKVIRGGLAGEDAVIRFGRERRVLSQLVHPNIARLLDAGETEDGDPYFVMEYVDGQSIDEYCDSHRLTVPERLELHRAVCAAVHHAHQNLVVHRDIKPRNILVTAEGVPKLLDFGIAKLISHTAPAGPDLPTAPEVRTMTPEYASPEQIRGQPVSTATDVYSLGVVLYELLCGRRPHHFANRALREVERVVCETEPERPSDLVLRTDQPMRVDEDGRVQPAGPVLDPAAIAKARGDTPQRLRRRLMRDLDNIVLMALRKEPQRRYSSAEALADDIKRHLDGHPVIAAPDTFGYRTFKFLTRHRVGVAASAAVLAIFVFAAVAVLWQWREAVKQRDIADRRFDQVRELAKYMLFDVHDGVARLEGSTPVRELLVSLGLRYLDALAPEVEGDSSLMEEIASGYQRLGDVQGGMRANNLGDTEGALRSYQHAASLRQDILRQRPEDVRTQTQLVASLMGVADMLRLRGDERAAIERYLEANGIQERVVAATPGSQEALHSLAKSLQSSGDLLLKNGRLDEAAEYFDRSMQIRQKLLAADPADEDLQRTMAVGQMRIARLAEYRGRPQEAVTAYRESVAIREALAERFRGDTRYARDLLTGLRTLGDALGNVGELEEALELHDRAVRMSDHLFRADPNNARGRFDLAVSRESLGTTLKRLERWTEAAAELRQAASLAEEGMDRNPQDELSRQLAASAQERLTEALLRIDSETGERSALESPSEEDRLEADLRQRRSLEIWRQIDTERAGTTDSTTTRGHPNVERVAGRMGLRLLAEGRVEEALALLRESQAAAGEYEPAPEAGFSDTTEVRSKVAKALRSLADPGARR